MAERHPWNGQTVATVALVAGVIGVGIGYGLAPHISGTPTDALAVSAEDATADAEAEEVSAEEARRRKRDKRDNRDGLDRHEKRDKRQKRDRKRSKSGATDVPSGPVDLSTVDGESWVSIHDPQQTWSGYSLVFYQRRVPMLIDMNGRIVHYWPNVRAVGRARLTTEGNLVYIGSDDAVREVDWNGTLVREYRTDVENRFPHHDLQWLPDDRIVAVYRTKSEYTDDLVIISEQGEATWTWESKGRLDADIPADPREPHDLTHFNSVQVIPDNAHHRAGDARFKPGNMLISARNLNFIYIVDPDTGDVVWKYGTDLDWQHEAVLLADDLPGAGNVLLFNNRYHSAERRSEVVELNPVTSEIVWRYSVDGFYSDTAGVAQKLPNGNVLITSSRGGRVFEVNPAGDVVWQWQPPYLPMRVNRYASDYCPQLKAMAQPTPKPMVSQERGPFIDGALYDFKLTEFVQKVAVNGKKRDLLTQGKVCHDVRMPGKPSLSFDFGFAVADGATGPETEGSITLTATPQNGIPEKIYTNTVSLAENGDWSRERVRVPRDMAYQPVELCVESTAADILSRDDEPSGLVVAAPKIMSGYRTKAKDLPNARDKGSKKAEAELQQRQLEALGYIE